MVFPTRKYATIPRLQDIAHHLVEAESHHKLEEEALFPALEMHDVVEPPSIMRSEHVELCRHKHELHELAAAPEKQPSPQFKKRVTAAADFLTRELEGHIFKEDNILYQIALQVLDDEEWAEIKKECDRIGCCCFTPDDAIGRARVTELGVRPLPPWERHDRIMAEWQELKPAEALRIINGHDPRPLHYQFSAQFKGQFDWEYEQKGPKDWKIKISRLRNGSN